VVNWDAVSAWGQWAGAVGTTAALGAAVALLRVEQKRDRDQKRLLDRAQAERVAVWPAEVRTASNDPGSPRRWGAAVRNGSDLPVYQVSVEFSGLTGSGMDVVVLEVVPPGDWLLTGRDLYRRPDAPEHGPDPQDLPPRQFTVGVRFTDAADRRWHRNARGDLVRAES
jgi:hypothetical protein